MIPESVPNELAPASGDSLAGGTGAWRIVGWAAALSVAVVVGYRYSVEQQLAAVTGLLLLAAGVLAIVRQMTAPTTGYAGLLVTAVLAPFLLRRNLTLPFLLAILACTLWILGLVIHRRRLVSNSRRTVAATVAFMAVAVLSFLVGQYPWFPTDPAPMVAQIGGLALFVVSGGLFLAVGHQIDSVAHLQRLTWIFLVAGGVLVLTQLPLNLPGGATIALMTEPQSVGSLFWVWLVAISFAQGLCNPRLALWYRFAALAIGALALARGLFVTFSWASGWLPPLVALGVILLIRLPRSTMMAGMLLITPVLLLIGRMTDAVMDSESYSWMTRLEAWAVVLDIVKTNPLLGFGPANYYYYTPLFPILGWSVSFNSHSNYIDLVAQTGVLGLAAFVWFVYEIGRVTIGVWRRAPIGFPKAYAAGALAGLVGSLAAGFLGDWIIPFPYNIGMQGFRSSLLFWFFLGGSLALHRLTAAQATVPSRLPQRVAPVIA